MRSALAVRARAADIANQGPRWPGSSFIQQSQSPQCTAVTNHKHAPSVYCSVLIILCVSYVCSVTSRCQPPLGPARSALAPSSNLSHIFASSGRAQRSTSPNRPYRFRSARTGTERGRGGWKYNIVQSNSINQTAPAPPYPASSHCQSCAHRHRHFDSAKTSP